jgi:PAS domain S-box-containing protein
VPRRDNGVRGPRGTARRLTEILGDALVEALRGAGDGSFATDPEGRIILWNGAAEAILGHTAAEVLGRPCCTLLRGEDVDRNSGCTPECAIGQHARRGKPIATFDVRTRTKAGHIAWINVSVLVIADSRTGAPFILHLFRDVTFSNGQLALAHEGLAAVSRHNGAPNGATALTRREREVLGLMGRGFNTAAMAHRLHLSRATVRNHVQNILSKLDVHSRLEAVAHGLRHRLL